MKKLPYNQAIFNIEEKNAVKRVLESDWLSGHQETISFEEELAKWWGMKYAVSTNSGSAANLIALQSLELPKGCEVITPAGGAFPTTISPIVYLGYKPVFVDVNLDTMCMVEDLVVGVNTGAVMFAHTLGRMPDMSKIKWLKEMGVRIVEDCCDAMGSEQNGKKAGTFGDLATVSFYPAHLMTTGGEGGAVLTNNYELYKKCRSIRDWGRDCFCRYGHKVPACGNRFKGGKFDHRYYYTNIGLNFKLTEMQAAFGREQLKRVDGFIERRKSNYNLISDGIGLPRLDEGIVPFAYPLLVKDKLVAMAKLAKKGVGVRTIFTGNILEHPAYKNIDFKIMGKLKNSKRLFKEGIFVGVGPHLSEVDVYYIIKVLKGVL